MDVISWSDDDDGLYDEECLRIQGNSTSSAAEIATAGDKNIAPGTRQGYIQTGHGRSHTQGWDLRNEIISIGGTTRRRTSLPKNDIIGMDGRNQPNYETSRRLSSGNDLRIDIMTMTGAAKDINPLQAAPSPTRSRTLSGPTRGRSSTTVSRVGNTQPYLRERSPLDSSAGAPVARQVPLWIPHKVSQPFTQSIEEKVEKSIRRAPMGQSDRKVCLKPISITRESLETFKE
ncbi:hypothetical protein BGZ58_006946 [Dissophora ornata]|nr:hypothetical protein BGZ58_006946 [Dissophora ornata]